MRPLRDVPALARLLRCFAVAATLGVGAVLAAPATKAKPPRWRSTETVASASACNADGCGARVRSQWRATTTVPLAGSAAAPDFPPGSVFSVDFGDARWSAPLSADAKYAVGARRATIDLQPGSFEAVRPITARLRWTTSTLVVSLSGPVPVTFADFVDDPGTMPTPVRLGLRACVRLADARADYGVLVTGARSGRQVTTPDGGYVLPKASARGAGTTDGGKGPPLVLSRATTDSERGKPNTSPFVDVDGTIIDGGSVVRLTYQLDAGPETDVAFSTPAPFPCGGVSVAFTASVTMSGAGAHTLVLRAYDDDAEVGTARHALRLTVPDLGPAVARIVPLDVRVPGIGNDSAGVGLIDATGRLWFQDSVTALEDGDHYAKLLASASKTDLTHVLDVQDMRFVKEKSPSRHNTWIALHEDHTVSIDGHAVPGLPPIEEIATSTGYETFDFTLLRASDGNVLARGTNREGQLGDSAAPAYRDEFAAVPGLADVARVAVAGNTCFALTDTGTLLVWGAGADRLRGDSGLNERAPGPVPAASPVVDFATDVSGVDLFTAHADGTVFGRSSGNGIGYLGNGAASNAGNGTLFPATQVQGLSGIRSVVRARGYNGGSHAFAIRDSDGALFGWGTNSAGEIGIGTVQQVLSPATIATGGAAVAEVQVFLSAVAARTQDGRVLGWGASSFQNPRLPAEVPGLTGVVQLHLTWSQGFALTAGGAVSTWRTSDTPFRPRGIVLR